MTFSMIHTCRVCGAETSVEQMVFDIIDDAEVRRTARKAMDAILRGVVATD